MLPFKRTAQVLTKVEANLVAHGMQVTTEFEEGMATSVSITAAGSGQIVTTAEELLRAAKIVEEQRAGEGDRRYCCPIHGLSEQPKESWDRFYECPSCKADALTEARQAVEKVEL